MLGAIIGDIVGSIYEFSNVKTKDFPLFRGECIFTDDTVMTLAVAKALYTPYSNINELSANTVKFMRELGKKYPKAGYGGMFSRWLRKDSPAPYNSLGNGSAMRVSAASWKANDIKEAIALSGAVTRVTHNHPEGIKGAEAVAVAIVLARQGKSKQAIKDYICSNYYNIDFTLKDIKDTYRFDETCPGTVPQAFEAFFESSDFEDAIKNAVSIGGDSDTLAAICGSVAEAYYGIPQNLEIKALNYLDNTLKEIYLNCREWNKILPY